ncbi:MAG: sulfur carrier protein ThiS, partial [Deltaproteobacteria bacterium]|nr:sulfur carrier protein ThiS [Deltaproteobacteria bacterium]
MSVEDPQRVTIDRNTDPETATFQVTVNGEPHCLKAGATVVDLVQSLGIDPLRVAIERNHEVVSRKRWSETVLGAGDALEVVAFVGGGTGESPATDDSFELGGRRFHSRLLVGTGKYRDNEQTRLALEKSGAEIVTVALRRVDLTPGKPNVLDAIDRNRYTLLPNTAGCYTAEEAIRTCRLARELGLADLVKLEVIGDPDTLFPDGQATLEAAKVLVKEGFIVLPYCMDDPILAR